MSAFSSAERRLTENVRLSLGLNCSLPMGGVTLRVKVNRLGQKIMLPILLSPEFRSDLVVLFTVVPAAAYTALHWRYLEPSKQRRLRNRLGELRSANREMILERRQAALEAVEVLRDQAVKRAHQELDRSGLVILEAWYGQKDSFPRPSITTAQAERLWNDVKNQSALPSSGTGDVDLTTETYWDVKIPLQALTTRSQLIVPGARSKANLLGFHDPVLGEKKHWVTYDQGENWDSFETELPPSPQVPVNWHAQDSKKILIHEIENCFTAPCLGRVCSVYLACESSG